jgi:hypothetical protein
MRTIPSSGRPADHGNDVRPERTNQPDGESRAPSRDYLAERGLLDPKVNNNR